jgi:diguanylate cyclase (GGDEF)-like protein/PAS domain S-box-containing protein
LHILRGEPASTIPLIKDQSNRFVFDHLALQRFDIPLAALPPGSIVKNRQYSFWELYQPQIIFVCLTFALLVSLVIILFGITQKLNRTRLALANLNANLEIQVGERTVDLSQINEHLQTEISERKWVEESLREAEQRFRSMFERHQAIMLLIDPYSGAIVEANLAASRFYGFSLLELRQMNIEAINCLNPEQVVTERERALAEKHNYFIFPHRLANGEIRTVEVHSTPIAIGKQALLFSIIHDITERKQAEEALHHYTKKLEILQVQLHEQAIRDPLTGAFNRRYLVETLEREMARAVRNQCPLCLLIMDIDHFKVVNDTYGHLAGDYVLQKLTCLLQQSTRKSDIVCRYGGEEFVILMPDSSIINALGRAEAWRSAVQQTPFQFAGRMIEITVSMGVATTEKPGITYDELLAQADQALYSAKETGRNRVVVAKN